MSTTYDRWKLASPPEYDAPLKCKRCLYPGTEGRTITIPADSDGGFGSPAYEDTMCRSCSEELGLEEDWDNA